MLITTVAPKVEKPQRKQRIERFETEFSKNRKSTSKSSSYRGTANKPSSKKAYTRSGKDN